MSRVPSIEMGDEDSVREVSSGTPGVSLVTFTVSCRSHCRPCRNAACGVKACVHRA